MPYQVLGARSGALAVTVTVKRSAAAPPGDAPRGRGGGTTPAGGSRAVPGSPDPPLTCVPLSRRQRSGVTQAVTRRRRWLTSSGMSLFMGVHSIEGGVEQAGVVSHG